jgi:uncharacterized membrane protein YgaE (UPF0421/DUF939 family)
MPEAEGRSTALHASLFSSVIHQTIHYLYCSRRNIQASDTGHDFDEGKEERAQRISRHVLLVCFVTEHVQYCPYERSINTFSNKESIDEREIYRENATKKGT